MAETDAPSNISVTTRKDPDNNKRLIREISLPYGQIESSIRVTADPASTQEDARAAWWWSYLHGKKARSSTEHGTLRVAEMFGGPGGLAQGVKQFCREAGLIFESRAVVDQDIGAVDVYLQNHHTPEEHTARCATSSVIDHELDADSGKWPSTGWTASNAPIITELHPKWRDLRGELDLLLAGPPCQGHSNLNNWSRYDDDRNEAYLDVPALAVALDVPLVIIENVPSVVHDARKVVAKAHKLFTGNGYHVESGTLKADLMGWPQTRARFFLIARKDENPPLSLAGVQNALAWPEDESSLDLWWAIHDLAQASSEDHHMHRIANYTTQNRRRINYLHGKGSDNFNLPASRHNETHKKGTTYTGVYGRLNPEAPAGTITSGFLTPGRGRYVHPTERRTITPAEAARIQGFPDNYIFDVDGIAPSKQQLTKWIGDAVPMPLGYAAAMSALGPGIPRPEASDG